MAILVATLEAAFESGLLEPLHMSIQDCNGTVETSTIQQGAISYARNSIVGDDLKFPLHLVVTDEVNNGKLDVIIETTEEAGDWIFHTQVSWLS
jgi:hypothetical protein